MIDRAQLEACIDKGLTWLKATQQADGSFQIPPGADTLESTFHMGYSGLATLTLLKCGVPPDDPSIQKAFAHLYTLPLRRTYSVSILILCIEARYAPPKKLVLDKKDKGYTTVARKFFRKVVRTPDLAKLRECVQWLITKRCKTYGGAAWRYPSTAEVDQDNSNTQYAMLALKGARRLGVGVPLEVFEKVADFLVSQQDATGPLVPWFPVPAADGPIAEMLSADQRRKLERKLKKAAEKAAEKAEKKATRERKRAKTGEGKDTTTESRKMNARGWSYEPRTVEKGPPPKDRTGPVPDRSVATQRSSGSMTCSGIAALCIAKSELENSDRAWRKRATAINQSIRDGCAWMALYFLPTDNPSSGPKRTVGWKYYYLYSVERAGVLAGTYRFGPRDWWDEGAAHLLSQQEPAGTWPDTKGISRLARTCFALLFLKRATIPLLPLPPKRVMTGAG
jgi:hypothetical protein